MDRLIIQQLRDLPIEGVAERLGLEVKRHKALCPFHDDSNPSLSFYVSRNTFKCFVCDAHGGTIDLAMKVLGKGFRETCQMLAENHGVILSRIRELATPAEGLEASAFENSKIRDSKKVFDASRYLRYFEHPFLTDAAMHFLYDERHLDPRVIRWCRINSYRDWLQIPYFNIKGNLIGVQSRYLGTDKNQPRFKFPYGCNCPIYNLPVLKMLKPKEPLYITEGASDCWAMLSSGHKAIAIPSATLLTSKNLGLLEPLRQLETPLHMYPDQDVPGEKLYLELTSVATKLGCCLYRHALPQGCKDFSDYYTLNHKPSTINHKP